MASERDQRQDDRSAQEREAAAGDFAGALDLLLADGALGVVRREGPTAQACGLPPAWPGDRSLSALRPRSSGRSSLRSRKAARR